VIGRILSFVRFSHTIFALPFAVGAALVAAGGIPSWEKLFLIVLAMVFARTAAMGFNRMVDWEIDRRNPRTAGRHKILTKRVGWMVTVVSAVAFVGVTRAINPLCFLLSPVALLLVGFYSLTKRFTSLCHFFLGLALAAAPMGAWLAVRGRFELAPLVLALAVLLWVAGFDLIYATQDHEFDRSEGLHSLVVRLGVPRSLRLASVLHWLMWGCLAGFGVAGGLGVGYGVGLLLVAAALFYEHRSAARLDIEGINRAFFASNAFVGVVFVAAIGVDLWLASSSKTPL
jgi:4-hydroxybenzoate polyprenyltransferase